MAKVFQMTEDKVAAQLGISRERLRSIREDHLDDDQHFQKNGATVVYTEDGVQTVIQILRDQVNAQLAPPAPPEPSTPPPAPPEQKTAPSPFETLRVLRTCPNPTWVEAFNESGNRVKCRVRSNQSMRQGIILKRCERMSDGTYKTHTRF